MCPLEVSKPLHSCSIRELVPRPDPIRHQTLEHNVHRSEQAKLKRKYKTFQAEVDLKATIDTAFGPILVHGRIDGIRRTKSGIALFEIKPVDSILVSSESLELAPAIRQLLLYGDLCMESVPHERTQVTLHLIVVDVAGKSRDISFPFDSTSDFLRRRLETVLTARHIQPESARLSNLSRVIEQDILSDRPAQLCAWTAIKKNSDAPRLLLSLPPGAGKTRLALRWALLEAAHHHCQVVWITAKARGRETVLSEVERYKSANFIINVVWKTTRERHCADCLHTSHCLRQRETQDTLFLDGRTSSLETCAHEQAIYNERAADLIIADLNYVLNPSSLSSRRAIYVIDEAQHWANRAAEQSDLWLSQRDMTERTGSWPAKLKRIFSPILRGIESHDISRELWAHFFSAYTETAGIAKSLNSSRYAVVNGEAGWYLQFSDSRERMLAAIEHAHRTLALSGSLLTTDKAKRVLFPAWREFCWIKPDSLQRADIRFVSQLDFSFPLTLNDHRLARDAIAEIHRRLGSTLLVLGQNRESNQIIANLLWSAGYSAFDLQEHGDNWKDAMRDRPDFLLAALGSSPTESVNPPHELFSAAIVLAPGIRPHSTVEKLRQHLKDQIEVGDGDEVEVAPTSVMQSEEQQIIAAANIVQAVGRICRDPEKAKPVFMLNQRFLNSTFAELWPLSWRNSLGLFQSYATVADALLACADTR